MLLWTWRIVVVVVGGVLLLAGFTMWFTPGPGWAAILLGLAVMASEFGWARRLLRRGQRFVRHMQNRAQEYRSARKTKYHQTAK
ncbi:PGPGW domain-containing protein [Spiractinospora alimapuensis]|uniref:PGPGW domain-containing protein n=1 Tax=Spiractinospora alimapuensis TaxID=2820884 RepID=UPI001F3A075C|nr:PGPGW domain-containing protein [Spiractinospora alimapuensis]